MSSAGDPMSMGAIPPGLRHQRSKRPKLASHGSRSNLAGYGEPHDLGAMKPCARLLREIMRNEGLSWPFNKPVDPIQFQDYYDVVKEPIDLGTIKKRLDGNEYEEPDEFAAEVRKVWANCFLYNQPGTDVHRMATQLSAQFEEKFRELDRGSGGGGGPGNAEMRRMKKQMAEMQKAMAQQNQLMQQQQQLVAQQQQMAMMQPVAAPAGGGGGRGRPRAKSTALVPAAAAQTAIVPVDETRDMTYEEKADVSARINKLNPQNLSKVVQIIKTSMPMLGGGSEGEIDVDINALDTRTLWKLHQFVRSCEATKRKPKKAPVTAAAASGVTLAASSVDASCVTEKVRQEAEKARQEAEEKGTAFEAPVLAALKEGAIRLLDTSWLLGLPDDHPLPRRQLLETRGQERPFISPARATELLLLKRRRIGVLSYCWLTAGHPDPFALHLSALQTFLRSKQQPDGTPFVDAVFWDFASLPQKPRTEAEGAHFQQGLSVMGALYASPVGTSVLELRTVPPRPAEFQGCVTVYSAAAGGGSGDGGSSSGGGGGGLRGDDASTAALGAVMSDFGEVLELEIEPEGRPEEASVRFATHAQAERAVAKAKERDPSLVAVLSYSGRPYAERGWPIFEDGVSREAVVWSRVYAQQHGAASAAASLPGKLYHVGPDGAGSEAPAEAEVPGVDAMLGRLAQVCASLRNVLASIDPS